MAVPTFIGKSVSSAFGATGVYNLPAGVTSGDFVVFVCETANETVIFPPPGWTELVNLGTGTPGGTSATKLHVCYRFLSAIEGGLIRPAQGNHQVGTLLAYRGVDQSNPIDVAVVTSVQTPASTSVVIPEITTVSNDCLVVSYGADSVDTLTNQYGGLSWSDVDLPASAEVRTNYGNGGGINYVHGRKPVAGLVSAGSLTLLSSGVQVRCTIALRASTVTDFLDNTVADVFFRGQSATINGKTLSWSEAPTYYVRLCTAAGTDATPGTELVAPGYAPQAITASLANFSGTHGVGTTTPSVGWTGQTSNNAPIDFGTVGAGGWGNLVWWELWDASSGGNRLVADYLVDENGDPTTFSAVAGVDVAFEAGQLRFTVTSRFKY